MVKLPVLPLLLAPPLLYGAAFFVLRPSINNDAGSGFAVLQSMQGGAPFNVLIHPDSGNIAKDVATFIAAWSPSQYELATLLQFDRLDLGQGIVLAVALCACLGIAGWYLLYRSMGFTQGTSLLSCLLIEACRPFLAPFDQYNGGEIILFGVAPWSALLIWRAVEGGVAVRALATFAALALATFAKLSGFIFASALLVGAAAVHAQMAMLVEQPPRVRAIRSFALAMSPMALAWIAFLVAFQLLWLSRGWTAVDGGHAAFSFANIYFPVVATVVSVFGFSEALGFLHMLPVPVGQMFADDQVIFALALPFCAAALGIVVGRMRNPSAGAVSFIIAACAAYVACFVILYHAGAAIYFDDRFFRPISLLLLPCLLSMLFGMSNRLFRYFGWAAILSLAGYGIVASGWHLAAAGRRPIGTLGFRHPVASAELVAYLHARFGAPPADDVSRVVYVPSPDIGLEIHGARVIATVADFEPLEVLRRREYFGRVDELVVIAPTTFAANGKQEAILRSFKDYAPDRWIRTEIGGHFMAFEQRLTVDQPVACPNSTPGRGSSTSGTSGC